MTGTRKFAAAAALALLCAGRVQAGGMAEPIVEAETIVEEASAAASGKGLLLPLLLLVVIGAIAAGGGGGGVPGTS